MIMEKDDNFSSVPTVILPGPEHILEIVKYKGFLGGKEVSTAPRYVCVRLTKKRARKQTIKGDTTGIV